MADGVSLDPSIPLRAGQGVTQPENPLAMAGQFMQMRALQNQNALFPGQKQLQQQEITRGDMVNNQAALMQAQNRAKAVAGFFGPAIAAGNDVTEGQIINGMAGAVANGIPADAMMADYHANGGTTGAEKAAWLRSRLGAGMSPGDLLSVSTPGHQLVNVGGSQVPENVAPAMAPNVGAMAPASPAIANTLSPEAATAPTPIGVTPKGAPVMGTRQQFIDKANGTFGTGRLPAALRGPNAAAQPEGVVTGQGPAAEAAQSATGGASAKAFQDIADQGVQAKSRGAVLDNMLGDTAQFTTGPGADAIQRLRQVGIRLGIPVDKDATSASESFNKLAAQIASQQGAGSDARLAVAATANPHADLSPSGVDLILRQLRGNEDYIGARAKLAAAYPDQSDRRGFEDKFGSNLDPRAFQYARMTQPQKATFINSMKDPSTFINKYKWAETHGLIGG